MSILATLPAAGSRSFLSILSAVAKPRRPKPGPKCSPAVRAKLREAVDELCAGYDAVYDVLYERPSHTEKEHWEASAIHAKAEKRLRTLMVENGVGAIIADGELYFDAVQDDGGHVECNSVFSMDASLLINLDAG